jgi:ABC-type polysaccharide/polyol phosphate transport system ATPase subunit
MIHDPGGPPQADRVIVVENVTKVFYQGIYRMSLRHQAASIFRQWVRQRLAPSNTRAFTALKDISFSISRGESVGIVGRNGAGKTTLLRVLSRITRPTEGRVAVHGKYATLIALGAAFNAELTGLQNIYLNAAIFGMNPCETDKVLDDILAFSELGEFINTPVKRYSSGMYARLGFSIAIHVMPEIIFLDEVLAVGDAGFRAKCYDRIRQFKDEGRTLVYVSHGIESVRDLCERCLWLDRGQLVMDGPAYEVTEAYRQMIMGEHEAMQM